MMKVAVGLLAILFATSAFAQSPPPKAAKRPAAAQAKPQAPMGCKLVGTVKGTKIWAGDCAAPSELRGSTPAAEPTAPVAPPEPPNKP